MNLLIVTQKADATDPILGFFHRWVEELARYFGQVTVICLEEGAHSFPANVRVLSLGKERGAGRAERIRRFYSYISEERSRYDAVFVHMNPVYLVLAGPLWKLWGKKMALWYAHRHADLKLRIAAGSVDIIFTAAPESLNLDTPKKRVVGHGIDTALYAAASAARVKPVGAGKPLRIIHIGRLTPIKNCDTLIEAAHILAENAPGRFDVAFYGSAATESDRAYEARLRELVARYGLAESVRFMGSVAPGDIPQALAEADATVNLAPAGGLDKAVLESMAAGVPAFASNEAFRSYFGDHAAALMFGERDAQGLAAHILGLFGDSAPAAIGAALQKIARERADVPSLMKTIADMIQAL